MCRNTISISWDGRLFDCDFNQMLELDAAPDGRAMRVEIFRFRGLAGPPRRDPAPLLRLHRRRGKLLRRRDHLTLRRYSFRGGLLSVSAPGMRSAS